MTSEEQYNLVLDKILEILGKYPVISVRELHGCKELETFRDDVVEMMVERLINSGTAKLISDKTRYMDNSIQVLPNFATRPVIKASDNHVTFSGYCLSLPPFNKFGLEDILQPSSRLFSNLSNCFGEMLARAKRSIKIISPFIDIKGLVRFKTIITNKVKDGVDFFILSRELTTGSRRLLSIISFLETLEKPELKESISVDLRDYHYMKNGSKIVASSIHAKSIIIDETRAYIGSGELRENSFEKNLELGVILEGPGIKYLNHLYDEMFQRSKVMYQW